MRLQVKICGIRTPEAQEAAARGGARLVGFVFYPPSPRDIDPVLAGQLARALPTGIRPVGLFVEPSDDALSAVLGTVPLAMIQLHGDETPARVAEIKAQTGLPVMKAVRVGGAADVKAAGDFAAVSDMILFDARPPERVTALPGGNGIAFDWSLLDGREIGAPWMLSGGLTPENLAAAVAATGAPAVDTSSGVEDRPGHKSVERIGAFLAAAGTL